MENGGPVTRTYEEAAKLARFCANQARIATVRALADEMWRLALEYQQEAAKIDSENNLPARPQDLDRVSDRPRLDICVHAPSHRRAASGAGRMRKRILVVEDQEDDRQIIRDMLAGTDYEITEAEDGEQALSAVTRERPDLILMEIQLPSMDSYETMRRIRADRALLSIPIIAVSSYAPDEEQQKARAAGCNEFLPKPYSPRQLLAKIRQCFS
jgi:two-component system cell cycle response regulator DivK